jgi:hypothetical protein
MGKFIVILNIQLSEIGYLQNYEISLPCITLGIFRFLISNLKSMHIIINLHSSFLLRNAPAVQQQEPPLSHLGIRTFCSVDGMRKYERFIAYPSSFTISANFILRSRDSVPRMLPF